MSETNNNLPAENVNSINSLERDIHSDRAEQTSLSNNDSTEQEKEINWHKLAHKLREHNRKLLKKVFQLEQEVVESNQALEDRIQKSQSNDLYKAKQAERINSYQEEIAELLQKISAYQQEDRDRSNKSEELTDELETLQQQVATLDGETTKLKASNQEKDNLLQEKNREIAELNIRFQRQQQYLLEYKAKNPEINVSKPIKAWSAKSAVEAIPSSSEIPSHLKSDDWAIPAIASTSQNLAPQSISKSEIAPRLSKSEVAQKQNPISSIAAVKLPRFSRQVEQLPNQ